MAIEFGSVVRADMKPRRGETKNRRTVVITPTKLIQDGNPFMVVAISSSFKKIRRVDVPVPYSTDDRKPCQTTCVKPSVAVCDWRKIKSVSDVKNVGSMPRKKMLEIMLIVQSLCPAALTESESAPEGY